MFVYGAKFANIISSTKSELFLISISYIIIYQQHYV